MAKGRRRVCVCGGGGLAVDHSVLEGLAVLKGAETLELPLATESWVCLSLLSNTELVVTWHKERGRGREEGEGARGGVHVTNMESVCGGGGE